MKRLIPLIIIILLSLKIYSQNFNFNISYKNSLLENSLQKYIPFHALSAEYTYFPIKRLGHYIGYSYYLPVTYYGTIGSPWMEYVGETPVYITATGFDFTIGMKFMLYNNLSKSTFCYLTTNFILYSQNGNYKTSPLYKNFYHSQELTNNINGFCLGISLRQYVLNIPFFVEYRYIHSREDNYDESVSVQMMRQKMSFLIGISLPAIRPEKIPIKVLNY